MYYKMTKIFSAYVTHEKHFIFAAILNFDALDDKCVRKISSFYFMITLTSTSVSHNFPVHKMSCLSVYIVTCNILCKNKLYSGVVSYFWQ